MEAKMSFLAEASTNKWVGSTWAHSWAVWLCGQAIFYFSPSYLIGVLTECQKISAHEVSVLWVQLSSSQNSPQRGKSAFCLSLHCQSPRFLVHTTKSQLKPEVNPLHDTTNGSHCYLSCMFLSHSLQLITTLEIKHQAICTFSLKIHFNFLLLELPCPLPHLLSASMCTAHAGYTWGVWWVTGERENIITIERTQDWKVWCNYIQRDGQMYYQIIIFAWWRWSQCVVTEDQVLFSETWSSLQCMTMSAT